MDKAPASWFCPVVGGWFGKEEGVGDFKGWLRFGMCWEGSGPVAVYSAGGWVNHNPIVAVTIPMVAEESPTGRIITQ